MNNLYFVLSEQLTETVWVDYEANVGYEEPYHICELVIAESPNQAKYIAWKNDNDFNKYGTADMRDCPKFTYKTLEKDIQHEKGIVTEIPEFQKYWELT